MVREGLLLFKSILDIYSNFKGACANPGPAKLFLLDFFYSFEGESAKIF